MEPRSESAPVPGGRPEDFVQSVGRAARILEVVGRHPRQPVKTIARRCGLNISTTYHLVRTLSYEGYLRRLPDGSYVIGGAVAQRYHDLQHALHQPPGSPVVLRHLAERTGLSAYLGCLEGGQMTVVDLVEGPGSPYLEDLERGLEVSAHATALGKALLAALPRQQRRRYLTAQELRPFTANTCTDPERLEHQLAALRADRPVVEHGEFRDGVACAACRVPGSARDGTVWAVVVSVRSSEVAAPVCGEVLLAARDLAQSLP